jgi:hypothetical protein
MLKVTPSAFLITLLCSSCITAAWASQDNPPIGPGNVTATIQIDPNAQKKSVAPSFLGLSVVLSETRYMVGTSSLSNPYFQQLLHNFQVYGNGPLEFRVLNDEAFSTTTVSDDLPAWANLYQTMKSSGHEVKYFVGVDFSGNFAPNGTQNGTAAAEAEEIHRILPEGSLLAYEIGNEPDFYDLTGFRSNYTYAQFKREYEATVAAIEAKHTGVPMAAPVFSGYPHPFMNNLDDFIQSEHAHLGMLDLHYYGGSHCNKHSVPSGYLLSKDAINYITSTASPDNAADYIHMLNKVGRDNFRIGEMNSIACGGQDGVSNTFQSALWFLDEAMSYASAGVSGINLFTVHADTAYYSPFRFTYTSQSSSNPYAIDEINPVYYGMLATAEMLQSKAAVLPLKLSTPLNIKAYATEDTNGVIRILLINKQDATSGDGDVVLHLAGRDDATVSYLRATNDNYLVSDYTHFTVDDKITLAGQTFKTSGEPQDGRLRGALNRKTVHPWGDMYRISLHHASAAIIEIPERTSYPLGK